MSYSKLDFFTLASQTSHHFDREGVLIFKGRQNDFSRRFQGCTFRWFHLCGNLLTYHTGPEPWCDPVGLLALENFKVAVQPQDEDGYWPFHLENGICYRLATLLETERILWLNAIYTAPYENSRHQTADLRDKLKMVFLTRDQYMAKYKLNWDISEIPICQVALTGDNLLCSESGRLPTTTIKVFFAFPNGTCVYFANTEIVVNSSNPCYAGTIIFYQSEQIPDNALVRLFVFSITELSTQTDEPIGSVTMRFGLLREAQRLRLPVLSQYNKTVGFLTINSWSPEPYTSASTVAPAKPKDRFSTDVTPKVFCHRRSQSLPPRIGLTLKYPMHGPLLTLNFPKQQQFTYRLHSNLGGEIMVHEILAEPKCGLSIAQDVLDIYVAHERSELQATVACSVICGDAFPHHTDILSVHHSVIHQLNSSKASLDALGTYYKPSCLKEDIALSHAPVNLHLQRMWVHNDTLNKSGFHDVITVGAFTIHAPYDNYGGLLKLTKSYNALVEKSPETTFAVHHTTVAYQQAMSAGLLRNSILSHMKLMINIFKTGRFEKLQEIKQVLLEAVVKFSMIFDPKVIERALSTIGWQKAKHADLALRILPKGYNPLECTLTQLEHEDPRTSRDVNSNILNGTTPQAGSSSEAVEVFRKEEDKRQEAKAAYAKVNDDIKQKEKAVVSNEKLSENKINQEPKTKASNGNQCETKQTPTAEASHLKQSENETKQTPTVEATHGKQSENETKQTPTAEASHGKQSVNETKQTPMTAEASHVKQSENETKQTPTAEASHGKQSVNETKQTPTAEASHVKQSENETKQTPTAAASHGKQSVNETKQTPTAEASHGKQSVNATKQTPTAEASYGKQSVNETKQTPTAEASHGKQSENETKQTPTAEASHGKQSVNATKQTPTAEASHGKQSVNETKQTPTAEASHGKQSVNETKQTPTAEASHGKQSENETKQTPTAAASHGKQSVNATKQTPTAEASHGKQSVNETKQTPTAEASHVKQSENETKQTPTAAASHGKQSVNETKQTPTAEASHVKQSENGLKDKPKAEVSDDMVNEQKFAVSMTGAVPKIKVNKTVKKSKAAKAAAKNAAKATAAAANKSFECGTDSNPNKTEGAFDYNLNVADWSPALPKSGSDDAAICHEVTKKSYEVQDAETNLPTGNRTDRKDDNITGCKVSGKTAKSTKTSAKSAKAEKSAKGTKHDTALTNQLSEGATINDDTPEDSGPKSASNTSQNVPAVANLAGPLNDHKIVAVNTVLKEKCNEEQYIGEFSRPCTSNMASAAVKLDIIDSAAIYCKEESRLLAIEARQQTEIVTSASNELRDLIKKIAGDSNKPYTASVKKNAKIPDDAAAKLSAPVKDSLVAAGCEGAAVGAKETDQISDHDSESVSCTPVTESASLGTTPSGGETETALIDEVASLWETIVDGSESEGAWGYTVPGTAPIIPESNSLITAAMTDYGSPRTRTVVSTSKQKFKPKMELPSTSTDHPPLLKRVDMKNIASCLEPSAYNHVSASRKVKAKSRGLYKTQQPSKPVPGPFENIPLERKQENLKFFQNYLQTFNDLIFNLTECIDTAERKRSCVQSDYIRTISILTELMKTIEECLLWKRMAHSTCRIFYQTPDYVRKLAEVQCRRDICFTQALTAVTVGLMSWLATTPCEVVEAILRAKLNVLCEFEGLLTLFASEYNMWGDMTVAIEDLQKVSFKICEMGDRETAIPTVVGVRGALIVMMPVPDELFARLHDDKYQMFKVTPVFFNIGINEKASTSQSANAAKTQISFNKDNLKKLQEYHSQFVKVFPNDPLEQLRASSLSKPLEEVMEDLSAAMQKRVEKNVEVLHLAALATRLMHGVRFTSCKSAKDRTGMSVTLEQVSILTSEYHLADDQRQKALDIMRSVGCRRANVMKNIGIDKYAFLKREVQSLPPDYRPPQGSYGSTLT